MTSRQHHPAGTLATSEADAALTPEQAGWGWCGLRIVTLTSGDAVTFTTDHDEMAVLPLAGSLTGATVALPDRPRDRSTTSWPPACSTGPTS